MDININDIFKFPNGKYQYKVIYCGNELVYLQQYYDNFKTEKKIILQNENKFLTKKYKIYNNKTGQLFLK